MRTEQEIKETIEKLRTAIKEEGFVPVPDGTRLKEHVYHQRIAAIDYLEWVIKTDEQLEEEAELAMPEESPCDGCYPDESYPSKCNFCEHNGN